MRTGSLSRNLAWVSAAPRMRSAGALIVLCSVSAFALVPLVPGNRLILVAFLAFLCATSYLLRCLPAFHASLFATLFGIANLIPQLRLWPLSLVMAIVAYGVVVLSVPALRRSLDWLQRGTLDRRTWEFILAIVLVSSTALVLWYALLKPDISQAIAMVPRLPPWAAVLAGIGFALVNAAAEEIAFRGVFMSSLVSTLGTRWVAVVVQAISFGVLHINGFPSGAWGICLSFIYAVMLGTLRSCSGGMLAVWIAHVFADITIFAIVFSLLSQVG
jgi:uncharacterized protein